MTKIYRFLSIALALVMLSACGSQSGGSQASKSNEAITSSSVTPPSSAGTESSAEKWKEKYSEPVTVTVGRSGGALPNWPDGADFEHNAYTDWLRETYNIDVTLAFFITGDEDFKQRVTLSISSNDLPDVLLISDRLQLNQLMSSGMVADLTDTYDEYASPLVRAMAESYGGKETAMATTYYEGRQYAMSDLNPGGQDQLLWIREDWRLQLGLPEPKTIDDFIALAQAFVDADMAGGGMTVGIEVTNPKLAGTYNSVGMIDPLFNSKDVFPRLWHDDGNGNLVYGSTVPKMKEVLSDLRSMYESGILAKDFSTRDWQASVASGQSGIFAGAWWVTGWPLNYTVNNNPNAVWKPYGWVGENGKLTSFNQPYNTMWGVVREGYSNPEILIRLMNASAEFQVSFDGEALTAEEMKALDFVLPDELHTIYRDVSGLDWSSWPTNLTLRFNDNTIKQSKRLRDQVEDIRGGGTGYSESVMANAGNILQYEKGESTDFAVYNAYMSYLGMMIELDFYDNMDIRRVEFPSTTATMETRWANLQDLEMEAMLKIIMGNEPIEYFDTFVEQWYSQGGEQITKEVNEQYQ